jgi:hypothetical protein
VSFLTRLYVVVPYLPAALIWLALPRCTDCKMVIFIRDLEDSSVSFWIPKMQRQQAGFLRPQVPVSRIIQE